MSKNDVNFEEKLKRMCIKPTGEKTSNLVSLIDICGRCGEKLKCEKFYCFFVCTITKSFRM